MVDRRREYRELVNRFVAWCGNNHLLLNVTKTKEMVVDFRRTRTKLNRISILGEEVEVEVDYRYLVVHLVKTDWTGNVTLRPSKGRVKADCTC